LPWRSCGAFIGSYDGHMTMRLVTYEYLPPTESNLALVSVTAQHPSAKIAPSSKMPAYFKKLIDEPACGQPSP
jgi:hypothetical protein